MSESAVLQAFDRQIDWCRGPAPFMARLLERGREWLRQDSAAHAHFAAQAADPLAAAVALRWAAALHHLALRGMEPWFSIWPPAPGATGASAVQLDDAIAAAWSGQRAALDAALARPPQTNEVQRSAALLPGLLHVAAATERPLNLLEVGSSAGLNLWCDKYRYDGTVWQWGEADAPLCLRPQWQGPAPALPIQPLRIGRRAGCDAAPVDLSDPGEALRLASFIWPEQEERLARLRSAASAVATWTLDAGALIQARSAAAFCADELSRRQPGCTTVLMHSVVWQYIAPDEQAAIRATLEQAGRRASLHAPLAWLRFEPTGKSGAVELRCRLWSGASPGGQERLLARCHPHGSQVEWLAEGAA